VLASLSIVTQKSGAWSLSKSSKQSVTGPLVGSRNDYWRVRTASLATHPPRPNASRATVTAARARGGNHQAPQRFESGGGSQCDVYRAHGCEGKRTLVTARCFRSRMADFVSMDRCYNFRPTNNVSTSGAVHDPLLQRVDRRSFNGDDRGRVHDYAARPANTRLVPEDGPRRPATAATAPPSVSLPSMPTLRTFTDPQAFEGGLSSRSNSVSRERSPEATREARRRLRRRTGGIQPPRYHRWVRLSSSLPAMR
jgi:hypothetical protein